MKSNAYTNKSKDVTGFYLIASDFSIVFLSPSWAKLVWRAPWVMLGDWRTTAITKAMREEERAPREKKKKMECFMCKRAREGIDGLL